MVSFVLTNFGIIISKTKKEIGNFHLFARLLAVLVSGYSYPNPFIDILEQFILMLFNVHSVYCSQVIRVKWYNLCETHLLSSDCWITMLDRNFVHCPLWISTKEPFQKTKLLKWISINANCISNRFGSI